MTSQPLWTPSPDRIANHRLSRFIEAVNEKHSLNLSGFSGIHAYSVDRAAQFWADVWEFCGVIAETRGERLVVDQDRLPGARFFPDAVLNFTENLLRRNDDTPAIIFRGEDKVRKSVTWAGLNSAVSRIAQAFAAMGLEAGDRVCAVMPNMPESIMAFCGANALGGIWSSCSPDFGVQGILDRFGQIEPRVLVVCDGYWYNGKSFDVTAKIAEVAAKLPSLEKIIVVDYLGHAADMAASLPNAETLDAFMAPYAAGPVQYRRLPFDHPLYILFSSGTTGVPKCIVHRAGGVLLKHLSEHQLHCGINPGDRLFYFTTCGWMMWNWLTSGLASQATLMLFDGSPFAPDEKVLFDFADEERFSIFGTSAKFIDAVKKTGWRPKDTHSLATVHSILSTGSTLVPESFDFVYDAIKADVHLASMSGGTDLCGCLVASNPFGAVWSGEIQAPGLGQHIKVYDDDGKPMASGKGELVNVNSFPSMPLGFWNDENGEKYHNAYFARFPNTWCQGDFAEWTEHGGMIIHGRSDATLNPGGVRIGTAEIYAQVEQIPEVIEGCAIGQDFDNDVRVVLFVRLAEGVELDDALQKKIRDKIKTGASPRHVPARIVAVADIPRTKSGKITELAVRDVVHGRTVKNVEALANPAALDLFRDIEELKS
ncbi:MAG: acetoacetate--CoA ligase [Anderseniella sp.]|jgi:acetoacetyl-CoA synthetase|nr:acetoacetate--CoA ligase [Anderseniella sp.]